MADVKRPTAQDIVQARRLMWIGFKQLGLPQVAGPGDYRNAAERMANYDRVFDYAAACLKAEEESERVPEVEPPEGMNDDGWIPWAGGDCPVPGDTLVEAEDRNGRVYLPAHAAGFRWDHYGGGTDIVRYRIAQTNGDSND